MKNNGDKSIANSAIICLSISLLLILVHFAKSDHEYADSNVFQVTSIQIEPMIQYLFVSLPNFRLSELDTCFII